MTPELEPLEILFLAHSRAIGRPWPPDPYMKAGARAAFCAEMAELHMSIVERKIDEIDALRAMIAIVQEEARAEIANVDAWNLVGAEYLRVHARHAVDSPFARKLPPIAEPVESVNATVEPWTLDADGWIKIGDGQ